MRNSVQFIIFCLVLLFLTSSFTGISWKHQDSSINFEIKNAGLIVKGTFSGIQTTIDFDADSPEKGTIKATLEATTVDTGIGLRDKHLRKKEYFFVDKYAQIIMKSTKIEKTGNNSYTGYFDLTMKGITKNIKMPFTFIETENKGQFKGEFMLNRKDYNLGSSSWIMASDVKISIQVNVIK